jgi:DNA-binding CsgD family transcriptional regulator
MRITAQILSLACITVVLLSLVKNIGFGFPSADLVEGVSLESSRLFYAAGLLAAGIIADTNRKYAALCCIAALAFPFGCLALSGEPISGTIIWALDYLFFGFFSVYRVVLFSDIAEDAEREYLAGFGLMFGRIGDALGTALWLMLETNAVALVAVAAVLFAATIFAFYHLFLRLYPARPARPKSEQQRFDEFAAAYGISVREREVLRLVLTERTNAEIAGKLFVTEGTVKYHVHNLFKKTGCNSRRELIEQFGRETRG